MNAQEKPTRTISPQIVTIIAAIIALATPMYFQSLDYGGMATGDFMIMAMTWAYYSFAIAGPFGGFMFNPFLIISSMQLSFLRLVFVYMLYRYFNNRTTPMKVILVGIAMGLFTTVFYLIIFIPILMISPTIMIPLVIPIPILLLYGIVIMKLFPLPEVKLWTETEKPDSLSDKEATTEETPKTDGIQPQTDEVPKSDDKWLKED